MIETTLHVDVQAMADILAASAWGDVITYRTLADRVGYDVQPGARYHSRLDRAREVAQREDGAVFKPVRKVGLYRRSPDELAMVGKEARVKIGRTARRGIKTLIQGVTKSHQGYPSEDAKRAISREQAALGILHHLTRDRNLPPAEPKPMPPGDVAKAVLAAMRKRRERLDKPPAPQPEAS